MNIPFNAVADNTPEKTCGGTLKEYNGLVSNKFYDPPHNWCRWVIETDPYGFVGLHFNYVKMRDQPTCVIGCITIYDGLPEDAKILGRICKNTDEYFSSSSNIMTLEYFSDDLNNGDSFEAEYFTLMP
ncbi:CUB and zona pellucida-like domain-containing protein 1 [Bufo gargarizans]|uniref:CUB and zona pellucida-like domain-containing protein 1 n=1 Tax=Bufo gargarizans TaxID=30331 RepID=UPI001CF366F2|nr:CUB and zona pellucida-like domain-containing protein 1 [Bufo gargarizans]